MGTNLELDLAHQDRPPPLLMGWTGKRGVEEVDRRERRANKQHLTYFTKMAGCCCKYVLCTLQLIY